jgi:protein tyrosine phosphatase (PTP) superfamily phosphohydrolase (DUF442 family)
MDESALAGIHNFRAADDLLGTSGQPTVAQISGITSAGYRTIINLALHDDPRYSLPDERATVESLGAAYVHIPVQFANPTEADLLGFFAAMDAHKNEKVWVHCAANMRVTAFLGLYRVIRQGWDDGTAFQLMHSVWEPNQVWSAFIASMIEKHRR